jgi:carbon-monoxide dehydrogenase small subunit
MKKEVFFTVNGEPYQLTIDSRRTLLEVLRESLGLKGTKHGCDTGECGACTVIIDGKAILACLTLAVACQGKNIVTIEGLAKGEDLDPLQKAFMVKGAIQCGFCTPGLVLSARALLDINPRPSEEEIKQAIAGNLCRCTGYVKVLEAIHFVAGLPPEQT